MTIKNKKVICCNCRYFDPLCISPTFGLMKYRCDHESNITIINKYTPIHNRFITKYKKSCKQLNKNNDCKNYTI